MIDANGLDAFASGTKFKYLSNTATARLPASLLLDLVHAAMTDLNENSSGDKEKSSVETKIK